MRRSFIIATGALGGLLFAASVAVHVAAGGRVTANDLGRVGAVLCLAAFISAMWAKAGKPQQAAYELGFQDGALREYDRGFEDGRTVTPVTLAAVAGGRSAGR